MHLLFSVVVVIVVVVVSCYTEMSKIDTVF